jgi:uncharacterized membrane protein
MAMGNPRASDRGPSVVLQFWHSLNCQWSFLSARGSAGSASDSPSSQSRVAAVDFARVVAIMLMIQGHTLDVLLAPAYREGFAFNCWVFMRGLTAPTFLLLSGFSFSLSTIRHWDSYVRPSRSLWRRLRRFGSFIFLGYVMHLPARSLQGFRSLGAAGWQSGLQVDVLQCIGLTLIALQLLVLAARSQRWFGVLAGIFAVAIVGVSPVFWAMDWSNHVPFSVAAYLNSQTGSLFPLFPWAGYIFAGASAGCIWARYRSICGALLGRVPYLGSPILIATGLLLAYSCVGIYGNADFWNASPDLFLVRVGCVGVLMGIVSYVEPKLRIPGRFLHSLARESLLIYFVHVCILYGSIWNPGVRQWLGSNFPPLPILGFVLLLLGSMVLLALGWNKAKRDMPSSRWVAASAIVALTAAYSF